MARSCECFGFGCDDTCITELMCTHLQTTNASTPTGIPSIPTPNGENEAVLVNKSTYGTSRIRVLADSQPSRNCVG